MYTYKPSATASCTESANSVIQLYVDQEESPEVTRIGTQRVLYYSVHSQQRGPVAHHILGRPVEQVEVVVVGQVGGVQHLLRSLQPDSSTV